MEGELVVHPVPVPAGRSQDMVALAACPVDQDVEHRHPLQYRSVLLGDDPPRRHPDPEGALSARCPARRRPAPGPPEPAPGPSPARGRGSRGRALAVCQCVLALGLARCPAANLYRSQTTVPGR